MAERFETFTYADLFKLLPMPSKLSKLDLVDDGTIPVYSATTKNNGCLGFTNKEPSFQINKDISTYLVFGDHTRTMNIAHRSFCIMNNVKVLIPLFVMSDESLLYIATCWKKAIPFLGYAAHWSVAKDVAFALPVVESPDVSHVYTADDIDWTYMEERIAELEQERIAELEQERIAELDAYLRASGLDNIELTDDERAALTAYDNGVVAFKEFEVGDVFEIYSPKKRFNANAIQFDGAHPYIARGSSNNGIRGYISEDEQYLSPAKSLSFGQDTATIFYQSQSYFTGDKIKVMILRNRELNDELAQYLIGVMSKAFSMFAWGQTSFSENVLKITSIVLPVINFVDEDRKYTIDDIDYAYMERYIRAIEKLVIADVVTHKDTVIDTTRRIVTGGVQ